MTHILVTGGAGFIGSNYIRFLLSHYSDCVVVNVDALTYAGSLSNMEGFDRFEGRYFFCPVRLEDHDALRGVFLTYKIDEIVHFAAESHVDRSIEDGRPFVLSNVLGTQSLLSCAREFGVRRFVNVSTDEVYGSLGDEGVFTEASLVVPNSPYSASKAGADLMVRAYTHTYGVPCVTTRCSNNYGPYQYPEKLIPLMIHRAYHHQSLPVYGEGKNVRDWIYVEDHCLGVDVVRRKGVVGEVYNIGGLCERANIDIVKLILMKMNRPESLITFVTDRLGHDYRYAMGIDKISRELGWKPKVDFETGLSQTIAWYLERMSS
jgi:dTDP-glucose 4,6-dehydratase